MCNDTIFFFFNKLAEGKRDSGDGCWGCWGAERVMDHGSTRVAPDDRGVRRPEMDQRNNEDTSTRRVVGSLTESFR